MTITKARIKALVAKLEKVRYAEQPTLDLEACKRLAKVSIKRLEAGFVEATPERLLIIKMGQRL